jgi:hypothetical protein
VCGGGFFNDRVERENSMKKSIIIKKNILNKNFIRLQLRWIFLDRVIEQVKVYVSSENVRESIFVCFIKILTVDLSFSCILFGVDGRQEMWKKENEEKQAEQE